MGWEAVQAHASQHREFSQVEDAVDISNKDDDFVAIFFLQPQPPASRALSLQ